MAFTSSKWCLLLFVLEVLILVGGHYPVRNGKELERYLCNEKLGEDKTLILNHSVNYEVSHNGFCIVNATGSIIIKSDSHFATVTCTHQNNNTTPQSNPGFAFINLSVVLKGVVFHSCGTTLPSTLHQRVNSSLFRFSNVHAATILFIQCAAIVSNINITNYYGFALVAVNFQNSSFFNMLISNNTGLNLSDSSVNSVGSGMLMLFADLDNNNRGTQDNDYLVITLFNCTFIGNTELISVKAKSCIPNYFYHLTKPQFTIVNAAALSIIFNQQTFLPVVRIKKSHLVDNKGSLAAAVLILMFNTTKGLIEICENSFFKHNINTNPCYGSALIFLMIQYCHIQECPAYPSSIQVLNISNTTISDHNDIPYGAVYLGVVKPTTTIDFYFKNVVFTRNIADESGACILATVYRHPVTEVGKVGVTLESIVAFKNSQHTALSPSNTGIFYFNNIRRVIINGSSSEPSNFSCNYGSVIYGLSSNIYLKGHVLFQNNKAKSGAAIHLLESILYFKDNSNVTFYNNMVKEGGGSIFGMKTIYNRYPECVLQIPFSNKSIAKFVNNSACVSGNAIYVSPIYSCYSIKPNKIVKSTTEYLRQFSITSTFDHDLLDISSNPYMIKVCDNKTLEVNHYPGETIHLSVSALDRSGNHVHSVVSVSFAEYDSNGKQSNVYVLSNEEFQVLKESYKNICSIINITIENHIGFLPLTNYQEIYILLSPFSSSNIRNISMKLSNCPLGFALMKGTCQCDYAVGNFSKAYQLSMQCDINMLSISMSQLFGNPWLGTLYMKNSFGITGDCPFEFCQQIVHYHSFVLVKGKYMLRNSANRSEHVPICLSDRSGVLCGTCMESYSVVFGSRGCYKCSNKWLWTILMYAVAGSLLIYLLYGLRLTLTTGTLNGIIFYAQASNGSLIGVLKEYYGTKSILRQLCTFCISFLSFLNLNLGFPLCFYNGMNELWKAGLSLVFPIYLLTIVVILIILSRYSTWLSNRISHSSVQVLVTVVHLSFSNLLLTIIYVFISSVIYTSDKHYRVWYWDGSVEYMGQSHRILVIISLVVTLSLILPYIVFLLVAT